MSCGECYYYKSISNVPADGKCCHYCFMTGSRRKRGDNGECLSCKPRKQMQRKINNSMFLKGANA